MVDSSMKYAESYTNNLDGSVSLEMSGMMTDGARIAARRQTKGIYVTYLKRPLDVVVSVVAIVIATVPMAIIAVAVKVTSRGPVIFRHERIGKSGKTFNLYKFRSMRNGADNLQKSLTAEQLAEYMKNFKLDNDPRITRVGGIIRKTSLDELPQLFNILLGHMSLVGPRPLVENEIIKYGQQSEKLLSVTPGLTGNWACSGRSDVDYDERMKMELYYVDNASAGLDAKILARTFLCVVKGKGAQ